MKKNLMGTIIIQSLYSGLTFFLQNNYGVQFMFYFVYMNLQISFAFLMATYFSSVRTATGMLSFFSLYRFPSDIYTDSLALLDSVAGYLYIFVSGLLGEFLFRPYVEDVYLSSMYKVH